MNGKSLKTTKKRPSDKDRPLIIYYCLVLKKRYSKK